MWPAERCAEDYASLHYCIGMVSKKHASIGHNRSAHDGGTHVTHNQALRPICACRHSERGNSKARRHFNIRLQFRKACRQKLSNPETFRTRSMFSRTARKPNRTKRFYQYSMFIDILRSIYMSCSHTPLRREGRAIQVSSWLKFSVTIFIFCSGQITCVRYTCNRWTRNAPPRHQFLSPICRSNCLSYALIHVDLRRMASSARRMRGYLPHVDPGVTARG